MEDSYFNVVRSVFLLEVCKGVGGYIREGFFVLRFREKVEGER